MTSGYRWPSICPVCASRRVAVYVATGDWSCWSCGADPDDAATGGPGGGATTKNAHDPGHAARTVAKVETRGGCHEM